MKIIFTLFLLVSTLGCSKVEWGYKVAPRVVVSKIDDAFDFDSDRFNKVRIQIDSDFKSNRKPIAETIGKHIDEILQLSEKKDLSIADLKQNIESIQKSQKELVGLFMPSFEEIIKNLSAKEFEHFKKYTLEKFKESDDLLIKKDDFYEKQMAAFNKSMDFFFDSVSKEQLKLYRTFLDQNFDFFAYQIEVRRNFLKMFETKLSDKEQLLKYVLSYYSGDSFIRSPEHQKKQLAFLDATYQLQLNIWKSTSEEQRTYFRKTLKELKNDFAPLLKTID